MPDISGASSRRCRRAPRGASPQSTRHRVIATRDVFIGARAPIRYESCQAHVTMITWGLRIQTTSAKGFEAQRILRSLLEPTRVHGGCLSCHVYQDVEEPDVLALVQEWSGPDGLVRYLRSEDRRRLVAVMELASRPPEIWVDTVLMREGLERLAALMGSNTKGEGQ